MSNLGQFFSVDSRPVSNTKGTAARLAKLFTSYLRADLGSTEKITSPFICLNVACPVGSYDPNIEPSKDDVLFTETEKVVAVFESFFRSIYGERSPEASDAVERTNAGALNALQIRGNQARGNGVIQPKHGPERSPKVSNEHHCQKQSEASSLTDDSATARKTAKNRSLLSEVADSALTDSCIVDEGETRGHGRSLFNEDDDSDSNEAQLYEVQQSNANDETVMEDSTTLNPWTIAKLNAPIRRQGFQNKAPQLQKNVTFNEQLMTPVRERVSDDTSTPVRPTFSLQSNKKPRANKGEGGIAGYGTPPSLARDQIYHPTTPLTQSRRGLDGWVSHQPPVLNLDASPITPQDSLSDTLESPVASRAERPRQPGRRKTQKAPNAPFVSPLGSHHPLGQRFSQDRRPNSLAAEGYQKLPNFKSPISNS